MEGKRYYVSSITGYWISAIASDSNEPLTGRVVIVHHPKTDRYTLEVERHDQGTVSREETGKTEGSGNLGGEASKTTYEPTDEDS